MSSCFHVFPAALCRRVSEYRLFPTVSKDVYRITTTWLPCGGRVTEAFRE